MWKIKHKWRDVKLNIATFLIKRAARIDSKFVECFAFEYAHAHYEGFNDFCFQKLRATAYED